MDEQQTNPAAESADTEQDFQARREKKVEEFVLDFQTDDTDSDGTPTASPQQEEDLSSYSTGRKPKKERAMARRKKHGCMYHLLSWCVILAISAVLSQFLIGGAYDLLGASRKAGEVQIEITPEMTEDDVVDALEKAGAIKKPFFFRLYAKVTKATYSPGTYVLERNADYELINNSLRGTANRVDTVKLTFIEGGTVETYAKKLEEANVCSAEDFLAAINEVDFTNYSFIKSIADTKDARAYFLEGYLFPDTYEFYKYEKPASVIKRFLNNMNSSKLTKERYDDAEKLGMTIDQVLTLASIIQKESGDPADMYKISSVFHNRLKNWGENGKLQSDVTTFYAQTLPEQYRSAYDTYICSGLPVGAVCNPGLDAIKAALHPAKTNYYYFVADVNGKTYFARTLAEHERNIAIAAAVQPSKDAPAESVNAEGD